jgi:hypothetical protein
MLPSMYMKVVPAIVLLIIISFLRNCSFAQVAKDGSGEVTGSESVIKQETKNETFVNDEEFHKHESRPEFQSSNVESSNTKISDQEFVETSETISGSGSISGSNNGIDNNLPTPGNDPLD